jgi:predicted O-methyltransferase YrrM
MSLKRVIMERFDQLVSRSSRAFHAAHPNSGIDLVLDLALRNGMEKGPIFFPLEYLKFFRSCIETVNLEVRQVKSDNQAEDPSSKRFDTLVYALRRLPAIEFSAAQEIARVADGYRANSTPIVGDNWILDVRSHFETSSSSGEKGRILATVVRFSQCQNGLELGTAWGISALFILDAMRAHGTAGKLTTLEGGKTQFELSSATLKKRYQDQITLKFGWTHEALPELVRSLSKVDFVFHDAGHSHDDYVNDFNAILPILAPGAIVLIDDIRWSDTRFFKGDPRCHEGWMKVVEHPKVRRAVEIGQSLGMLMLGS